MTTRFASAAELMCRVLGMPAYEFAVIGHPISSASDDDLAHYARATLEQARRLLMSPSAQQARSSLPEGEGGRRTK